MQIANSRYHKIWEVKIDNGFKKVNLSDSRKLKDDTFENWTWFDVALVGNAKNVHLEKGDTITIISGQVQKRKYNDKFYDNVVIFELEVTKKADPSQNGYGNNQKPNVNESYKPNNGGSGNFEDNIPFMRSEYELM